MRAATPHRNGFVTESLPEVTKSQLAPVVSPHEFGEFTPHELRKFTDDYSQENFLGQSKFAKFYRGKMETRAVTVKIFIDSSMSDPPPKMDKHSRFQDEIKFLHHHSGDFRQQNLAKLIGSCPECLGVVYDINPRDTLQNLMPQDNFTWLQRMNVALQLAHLLAFIHNGSSRNFLCDIDAAHIMVDQEYNMVLLDFSILDSRCRFIRILTPEGARDHRDLQLLTIRTWYEPRDVSSFGVLLLSLISKTVFDISRPDTSAALLARKGCKEKMSSTVLERNAFDVHEVFKEDLSYDVYDANKTMKLALSCINLLPKDRPTMKEVCQTLEALHVCLLNGMGETVKSEVLEFLPWQLRKFTGEFSEETFLGKTQFGKLYRGRILDDANQNEAQTVTVKIWEDSMLSLDHPMENLSKLADEVYFLQHPSVYCHHKNLAKPIGYSRECELLGIVYDLNPRDTLHNLILKDDFTWHQRIKVALQFANLLVFFHDCNPPYIVRNIDAAHIMVDQDCNPVLFDIGMLVGGVFGSTSNIPNGKVHGAPGYEDLHFLDVGGWSITCDVFSYGVLLLSLIAKTVFDASKPETSVALWAKGYSIESIRSFELERMFFHVDKIFKADPDYNAVDAYRIIKLAMSCIEFFPEDRPSMKQTCESLQALRIVQRTGIGGARDAVLREFLPQEWREFIVEKKFLGNTQFAKLYSGRIPCGAGQTRAVTVKMWDFSECRYVDILHKMSELMDEVYLLQHHSLSGHLQNLAKPIGYSCNRECSGILYDVNPRGTLHKLIRKDNFKWLQRIRVALQLARLFRFLHRFDPPFIIRNISAAHILVDKEYNPVLVDFGMMMGGLFGNARDIPKQKLIGAPGYEDLGILTGGGCYAAHDVFSFGVVLISLFAKVVSDAGPDKSLAIWAYKDHKSLRKKAYLDLLLAHVHERFKDDVGYDRADALEIIMRALDCMDRSRYDRPTMGFIIVGLKDLRAAELYGREVGIKDTQNGAVVKQ